MITNLITCAECGASYTAGTLCAICELKRLGIERSQVPSSGNAHKDQWSPERIKAQVARNPQFNDEVFELYVDCRTIHGTTMFQGFNDNLFFKTLFTWFRHMMICAECEMCARGHSRQVDVHIRKKLKTPMLAAITKHLEKHGASPALMKSLTEIPDRELLGYAEPCASRAPPHPHNGSAGPRTPRPPKALSFK